MQKVIYLDQITDFATNMEPSIVAYIAEGLVETYESFNTHSIVAFDWQDLTDETSKPSQVLIYIDHDDLFYICENEAAYTAAKKCFVSAETNEYAMYLFFKNLLRGSTKYLEGLEEQVSQLDDDVSDGTKNELRETITRIRIKINRTKKYYDQLDFLFGELCDNDNLLISENCLRYFEILRNRTVRLSSQSMYLWEYIHQVRESYQSQIEIEQNNLMKVFTMVTSIFLPLTLIVGWYGMNFQMPELKWRYGYPFLIAVCILVSAIWYIIFKKKKWF
ncbi:putative magnesium and cobalt transporter [Ruminococcus sp. CAG:403]|nr:putative magnesium and cobalt transporter [Ruminococcus sp. CAG:403]